MPVSLNHLNLVVADLDAAVAFFAGHFGFAIRTRHAALAVLDGADGFVLVLSTAREALTYPPGFHVGFLVDDAATVDAEDARLPRRLPRRARAARRRRAPPPHRRRRRDPEAAARLARQLRLLLPRARRPPVRGLRAVKRCAPGHGSATGNMLYH